MTDLYTKVLITLIACCFLWLCFFLANLPEIALVVDYLEEEEPAAEPYLVFRRRNHD